ncbi:hypothetical protein ACP70R_040971 [Stipagrostis hirtigluma subsp. patula]
MSGKGDKADWCDANVKDFIDICKGAIEAGNRPNGQFTRNGWKNLGWGNADATRWRPRGIRRPATRGAQRGVAVRWHGGVRPEVVWLPVRRVVAGGRPDLRVEAPDLGSRGGVVCTRALVGCLERSLAVRAGGAWTVTVVARAPARAGGEGGRWRVRAGGARWRHGGVAPAGCCCLVGTCGWRVKLAADEAAEALPCGA